MLIVYVQCSLIIVNTFPLWALYCCTSMAIAAMTIAAMTMAATAIAAMAVEEQVIHARKLGKRKECGQREGDVAEPRQL